ncbi:hypothetical protein B0H16DRAFT_1523666 [Mycena metata]|uniref:Uncharacterized protein n=1 Tax=Mycena metata TaxID=1033252 RepID=A0AAD7JIN0_9AGAR|nr:hypothetical protein B0H16DRAFT_1523666 [Mycena metata]
MEHQTLTPSSWHSTSRVASFGSSGAITSRGSQLPPSSPRTLSRISMELRQLDESELRSELDAVQRQVEEWWEAKRVNGPQGDISPADRELFMRQGFLEGAVLGHRHARSLYETRRRANAHPRRETSAPPSSRRVRTPRLNIQPDARTSHRSFSDKPLPPLPLADSIPTPSVDGLHRMSTQAGNTPPTPVFHSTEYPPTYS